MMLNFSKHFRLRLRTVGVALPFLLAVAATPTLAPRAAFAQTTTVGVVDEDKLADGFKKYKDAVDAIDKRAQSLDAQIPARELLPDDEGKNFDTLIAVANPTAAQTAQLQTLINSGMAKRTTFMGLVGKAGRTAEEEKQMKALQDQMTKNGPALRAVSELLLAAIRQQQDDTDKQFTDRANDVVKQVATEKKLSMVVRKKALVWSLESIDITADVLSRLNKG